MKKEENNLENKELAKAKEKPHWLGLVLFFVSILLFIVGLPFLNNVGNIFDKDEINKMSSIEKIDNNNNINDSNETSSIQKPNSSDSSIDETSSTKRPNNNNIGTVSLPSKRLFFKCPVDIEIYDEVGTLVGRVVDNVQDYNIPISYAVSVRVENDDRIVTIPTLGEYTFKITGTDSGTMDFIASDIDLGTFELGENKEFTNISLEKGKEFALTVTSDDIVSEIKLFVTQDGVPISEVKTDGTEISIN